MDNTPVEVSQQPSETRMPDQEPSEENMVTEHPSEDARVNDQKYDMSEEQVTSIMEVIAATGKFWHDWDMLKSLLSTRLKQVLADYPEARVSSGDGLQQNSSFTETYSNIVIRLDEALLSFTGGPPFTLQRLCEILLAPKSTYSVLSKLALALEKNLLVTSTLTMCTDPYPTSLKQKHDGLDKVSEVLRDNSVSVPNGVEIGRDDDDEEMVEAETIEVATNTDTDIEMQEEKITEKSDSNSNQNLESHPSIEASTNNDEEKVSSTSETS